MGGRMCTRKDVAEHAGVSVTTVSNVLNHSKEARPEIVERVKKAAKELNYHPNLIAKGLKMNNSMQVGVIISEINNPYFIDVLQGIEEEAAVHGYNVSIFFIKGDIWHKYKDLMGRRFCGRDQSFQYSLHAGIADGFNETRRASGLFRSARQFSGQFRRASPR